MLVAPFLLGSALSSYFGPKSDFAVTAFIDKDFKNPWGLYAVS